MARTETHTTCCIVGGGPAGMMLGYLLARSGVAVTVLEKHKDFYRDFRGDTVHPSTLELMRELGLLQDFLNVPHQQLNSITGALGDFTFTAADFRHIPAHCKFIAFMPQWDFLNFLSAKGREFPSFDLRMQHQVVEVIHENGRVIGAEVQTPDGLGSVYADLVVGCDGRHATTRSVTHAKVIETGAPIDVLWFRISRRENDPEQALGNVNFGKALILINRGDYFQAGLIVQKGSFDNIKRTGLDDFRESIRRIAPYLGDRVHELQAWNQVQLLSVQINRLEEWHQPGMLFIGDAAHAMSPAGGVGINLAIQDAVATANLLAGALREGKVTRSRLAAVQRRREFPTRVTQQVQVFAHKGFQYVFAHPGPLKAPWQFKAVMRLPFLKHIMGRAVGIGVRAEHIQPGRSAPQAKAPGLMQLAVGAGIVAGVIVRSASRARPSGPQTAS